MRTFWKILGAVSALGLVLIAIAVWLRWPPAPQPKGGGNPGRASSPDAVASMPDLGCDPAIDTQIQNLVKQQRSDEWQQARDAWQKLNEDRRLCPRQREEVSRNLALARQMLPDQQINQWKREPDDEAGKPQAPPPPKTIEAYYPAGRTVRSLALFDVDGECSNQRLYVLRGRGHFALQVRVATTIRVLENNGDRLRFKVEFSDVSQHLALSDETLRLEVPDDALLREVFALLEQHVLELHPVYTRVKWLGSLVDSVDPGLEGTLTEFARRLKAGGIDLFDSGKEVEMIVQIEQLAGQKLEIEYVRDLGITNITVLEGQTVDRHTLASLAHQSSLLLDYYLFPTLDKQSGDKWEVRAEDVVGIVGAGFQAEATGEIVVERKADVVRDRVPLACLQLKSDSRLQLAFDEDGELVDMTLLPKTSELLYSTADRLLRYGRLEWDMQLQRIPRYYLIFGSSDLKNVHCKSYYESEAAPGAKATD